jgi:hypothetical protein
MRTGGNKNPGWLVYFALLAVCFLPMFARHGLTPWTVGLFLFFTPLFAVPFYLGTRCREAPPQRGERIVAGAWLLLRRLLAFGMALLFLAVATHIVVEVPLDAKAFAQLAFSVLVAAFLVYFGWVGQGPWRYRLDDDIRQHRENRERFRWPW